MEGMGSFEALASSGSGAAFGDEGVGVAEALGVLAAYVREAGRLRAEGAWELHRGDAHHLAARSGVVPNGGWARLVGLAAGAQVLRARDGGFEAGIRAGEVLGWGEDESRRRLVEGFTRWLIPPGTAAGWFVALGIHPLWGLKLARQVHREGALMAVDGVGFRDESILGARRLEGVRRHVFVSLSVVVGVLRRLSGERVYEVKALVRLVEDAMRFAREVSYEDEEEDGGGLRALVEGVEWRAVQHAVWAMMDEVLVPSRAVRWEIGRGFGVRPGVLEQVRVGALGVGAQDTWVRLFLNGSGGRKVA